MSRTSFDAQHWGVQRRAAVAKAQELRAGRAAERLSEAAVQAPTDLDRHLPCCTCSFCCAQKSRPPPLPCDRRATSPLPSSTPTNRRDDGGGWSSDFTDLSKNGFDSVAAEQKRLAKRRVSKHSQQIQKRQPLRARSVSLEPESEFSADTPSHQVSKTGPSSAGMRARVKPSARADDGPSTRINFDKRTSRHMHANEFKAAIAEFRLNTPSRCRIDQNADVQFFARKRPLFEHELKRGEYDVITAVPGWALVHICGMAADLQRMHVTHTQFPCSESFGEGASNDDVHSVAMKPLIEHTVQGGMSTCLMYGATGSGKTYTMTAMQELAAVDLCAGGAVQIVMLELAGKDVRDLLSSAGGHQVTLCDTASGDLNMVGASVHGVASAAELLQCLSSGQQRRTTCGTFANTVSSRSHMVVFLMLPNAGTLVLVDCAGSERKEDSYSHTAERQKEGAEINSSLHALKECIRALTSGASHVPYRMNNLTRVLRGSFTTPGAKFHVVATVAPGCSDAEHSVATLRMGCSLCGSNDKISENKQEVGTISRKQSNVVVCKSKSGSRARSLTPTPSSDQENDCVQAAVSSSKLRERHNFYGRVSTGPRVATAERMEMERCIAPQPVSDAIAASMPVKSLVRSTGSLPCTKSVGPPPGAGVQPNTASRRPRSPPRPARGSTGAVPKPLQGFSRQAASPISKEDRNRSPSPMNRSSISALHPSKWSSGDLQSWLHRQKFLAKLPAGADGRTVIRWSVKRWTEACCGDESAGLKAFNGLRLEIDRVADEEKQRRKQVMQGR